MFGSSQSQSDRECADFVRRGGALRSSPAGTRSAGGGPKAEPVVRCDGLSVIRNRRGRRPNGSHILRSVNVTFYPGDVVAVVGPNGAGKTTLLRVLAGLMSPSAGGCQVCGLQPWRERRRLARQVGYCPEGDWLYDHLTVLGNLTYVAALKGVPAMIAAGTLADTLNRLGLARVAHVRVATLSAGWRRRVAVAAAFLHRPQVVLLDEPLREVDFEGAEAVYRMVRELAGEGACCVVATQDLAQVQHLGSLLVLEKGALIFTGTVAQLLSSVSENRVLTVHPPVDGVTATALREQHGVFVRQVADGSRALVPSACEVAEVNSFFSQAGYTVRQAEATLEDAYVWLISRQVASGS